MMYVLIIVVCFIAGYAVGLIVNNISSHRNCGYGYFITKQINENECTFNIRIPDADSQELHKKKSIILKKEDSQK